VRFHGDRQMGLPRLAEKCSRSGHPRAVPSCIARMGYVPWGTSMNIEVYGGSPSNLVWSQVATRVRDPASRSCLALIARSLSRRAPSPAAVPDWITALDDFRSWLIRETA
jgi:hypothetical protein